MNLDTDFLQAPRIEALKRQIASAKDESDKQRFLKSLVSEIVQAVNGIANQQFDNNVHVGNLDEVKASLRNELTNANKPIASLLKAINLTAQEQTKFMAELQDKSSKAFGDQYEMAVVRRVKDVVEVSNLSDIPIIDNVTISNLADIQPYFKALESVVKSSLKINLPAPLVNVQAPVVNVPETQVNIPPVDLTALLESLYEVTESLKKIKSNNKSNPLAVRLTDGAEWIKEIVKLQEKTSQAVAAFAGGSNQVRILGPNMDFINPVGLTTPSAIGDGSKTVTTAGTRVALDANTACRKVIVTALSANTDTIWLGGSTVAAGRGRPLVSLQAETIDIDNLNKVYIDSVVNGEGVSFTYIS